jgi:putative peptidoglycan lipid II flippase
LFPVIVIVILAILALTFGVELAQNLGKKKAKASPTATAAPTKEIKVATVDDFDPLGNKNENHKDVDLAIDGDSLTKWSTVGYTTQDVGGKGGVGLLFDLGSSVAIGTVRIQTDQPGWVAEIRVSDTQGTRPSDYRTIDTFTAALPRKDEPMPRGTRARYVLLWITSPP